MRSLGDQQGWYTSATNVTRDITVTRDHLNGFPAALCAGVAIWCSLGTIGLVGAEPASVRVALLAPWWLLPLAIAGVFLAIRRLRLSPRGRSPLFGSAVLILPWLPFPIPAVAHLWIGPFMAAVWLAVVVGVIAEHSRGNKARWFTDPQRAPVLAVLLSLGLYAASAVWLAPLLPDGDEPHYLILAQSLIKDGDLRIENNHRRGDYLGYSLNAAMPDYLRRGVNGEIYSIHAPGLPMLIAPAMALFGYPGVVAFLGLVAALSTGLVWSFAYRATASVASAWFGWASCALTAPFLFQATEVFPDAVAATCLLLGTWPLWDGPHLVRGVRLQADLPSPAKAGHYVPTKNLWRWILSGLSLAILPWLQTRLAVLAIAAAVCLCLRARSTRQLLALAAAPAISAALWFGFFMVVYGTANPTAPYGPYTQTSAANLVRGWPGLLFDQQFGLIPNAPVYGFVLAGVLTASVRLRRWGWETLALTVPYMSAVGSYQMWWGGTSVPARLLTPITLILGMAAAHAWQDSRTRAARTLGIMALIATVIITFTLAGPDHGRLLLNFRDGISLWLEWANDVIDLPKGLPSLFHDDRVRLWLKVAAWMITTLLLWLALRLADSRSVDGQSTGISLAWPSISCTALALMIAFTAAWHVDGTPPLTPDTAELNLARHASGFRSLAYDFTTRRFERTDAMLAAMRIGTDRQRRPVSAPVIFGARSVPAGIYSFHVASRQPAEGRLIVHAGSSQLPLLTVFAATPQHGEAAMIQLPAEVRSLTVEADAAAARSRPTLEITRLSAPTSDGAVNAGSAHSAAHYEAADVFFLDEHAYPEPAGFWIAGGRTAAAILANRGDHRDLFLRNAPVDNHVTIDVNGDLQELMLGPGEERLIRLPNAVGLRPLRLRVTSQSGFRPSTVEPGNADLRYLGVWIEAR